MAESKTRLKMELQNIKRMLVIDPKKANEVISTRNVVCTTVLLVGFIIYIFIGIDGTTGRYVCIIHSMFAFHNTNTHILKSFKHLKNRIRV